MTTRCIRYTSNSWRKRSSRIAPGSWYTTSSRFSFPLTLELRPGMKLPMHLPQTAARHVSVNFRGADVRVAEQFLNHSEVGAMVEEVRGKTVTQHVRRDVSRNAGQANPVFNALPQRDPGEQGASPGNKDVARSLPRDEFGA